MNKTLVNKTFVPTFKLLRSSPSLGFATMEQLRAEPSFHKSSLDYVREHGGDMSRRILHNIEPYLQEEPGFHFSVDSRVTMTQPGDYLVRLQVDPDRVWGSVEDQLSVIPEKDFPSVFQTRPGDFIEFNQTDIHRATPCVVPGWRLFFRITSSHRKPVNEIRNQVQVYTQNNAGW